MPGEKPAPGPLRNGNPRRDLKILPCCGARTRAGLACRQPAMRNGRCRMHGGASTGARTDAGRLVLAAKATRHGFHTPQGHLFLTLISTLQKTTRLLNQARRLPEARLNRMEADLSLRPDTKDMVTRIKVDALRALRGGPPAHGVRIGDWRKPQPDYTTPEPDYGFMNPTMRSTSATMGSAMAAARCAPSRSTASTVAGSPSSRFV